MISGQKALEADFDWCNDYHCAGDCGLKGHGYQHKQIKSPEEIDEEDRLLTMFANTRGHYEGDRAHILRFARAVIAAERQKK